jgi:diguanylate cyclase (GGDEF)-like protein/PAS domain S-box-containing protein
MTYVLIINAAVSVIVGMALVLIWRRDRNQTFSRYIGFAHLAHALLPLAYLGLVMGTNTTVSVGIRLIFAITAAIYTALLVLGTVHLAHRTLSMRSMGLLFAVIAGLNAIAAWFGNVATGQWVQGFANTLIGVICTYWLWQPSARHSTSEKLVGPFLILLGMIPLFFAATGQNALESLTSAGTLLRTMLGLVLLYAAVDRSNSAIQNMQNRFERLSEKSVQGILISLLDRKIVYANPACLAIYGVANLEQLNVATVARTIPKIERANVARIVEDIQNGTVADTSYEAERFRADGTRLWLRFHYFQTEWDGEPAVQVLISDETDRQKTNQALAYQALHDELTGLPNRASLLGSLRTRCTPGSANPEFVLILMNLDRFKLFNEAHGPSMGDQVLKTVGQALRKIIPEENEVMRLAGDEFALISAPYATGNTAVEMVSAVKQLFSQPFVVQGLEVFIDASLGIALYPSNARDSESLLRAANAAMHVAKQTPGISYRLAEKAFERGSSNTLEQEQSLRQAIENGDIQLVYQPKVDAHTGLLTSFEALARWRRAGMGDVSPVDFIAAAERTGLINTLGTTLLRRACQQIALWQAEFSTCVPVAVNVSPLQMLDRRFPQLVAKVMEETGVQPHLLTLEITESSAVQNLAQTVAQVDQLRTMGVHVAMDDFGTGFSSLNMLRSLHLHSVKIDRGLIEPLPSPDAIAVVRAICQLADALHLHVVAEGVETAEQAHAAKIAGCAEIQGYFYSSPLPPDQAAKWMVSMVDTRSATLI